MLVDTHAHLNFKSFKEDLEEVIKRAKNAGVEKIIVVGADLKTSQKAVRLAQRYKALYASVGIHPHHVNYPSNDIFQHHHLLIKTLTELAKNEKVVAIGETGLDYYQYKNSQYGKIKITKKIKDSQKSLFQLHLEIAKKINKPLIIHCREAFDDLLKILTKEAPFLKRKGVLHCFDGSKNHLNKALDLGFYLGFNGIITYSANNDLRDLVKGVPIERILLETDSPFLAPKPLKGARNEPKNLKIIAKEIAHLKNTSLARVEKRTIHNYHSLFPEEVGPLKRSDLARISL